METLYTVLILIVAAAFIYGLYYMQKKRLSFTKRVLAALVGGIAFGAIIQLIFGTGSEIITEANVWISIIGSGYVRLLNMIVIPLVFVAITSSIVNQEASNLKKSAFSIIAVLMITTAIAAGLGATVSTVFNLDSSELLAGQAEADRGACRRPRDASAYRRAGPVRVGGVPGRAGRSGVLVCAYRLLKSRPRHRRARRAV